MSRFIEKLNMVAKGTSPPIGFQATRASSAKPQMLLIASLTEIEGIDVDSISGADAVVFYTTKAGPGASFFDKAAQIMPDTPWGCWMTDASTKTVTKLAESGCDFAIFPADSAVLPQDRNDKPGRVLQIEPSLGDSLLRAINDLPVDAVLVAGARGDFLNWQHLMSLRRLTSMLSKPLLVTAPPDVTPSELEALWQAGVDGVVVTSDEPLGKLEKLRQEIGKFASSPRRRGKAEALLPYIGGKPEAEPEEEEEEEE